MNSEINFIEKKIKDAIDKYDMLKNVNTVILGVSGGADSMALLKFFEKFSKTWKLSIVVAHVNHCLRGEESDRDENFVREYCEKNDIKLEILRINVNKIAKDSRKGVEECARKLRYDFFNELSAKYNGKIATAHTLSDSIETVLINFTRGTGAAGLRGISAKRANIIRPMIALKRTETQRYCEKNGVFFVIDSTNLKREYTRNKIRLDVIPILKQINSEFETVSERAISFLKSDDEYLNNVAKKFLIESYVSDGVYDLKCVKLEPFPILSRFVRLAVFELLESNVTARHIELILDLIKNDNGAVVLPHGVKVSVEKHVLCVKKTEEKLELTKENSVIPFNVGTILTENQEKFIIKLMPKNDFDNFVKLKFLYAMDYDKISSQANFRTRRSGDKFCQFGRGVTKSVKKLFNELKIPQNERDEVLILADNSEVLWINKVGISESVKITENTNKVAIICSEKEVADNINF